MQEAQRPALLLMMLAPALEVHPRLPDVSVRLFGLAQHEDTILFRSASLDVSLLIWL